MVDILAISAHPDDIELHVSGTLLKARHQGHTFAVCDITAGERGSRGSRETRAEETRRANRVLGLADENRWNLGMADGNIELNQKNILTMVRAIRHFRPRVVLCSWDRDRHPDHVAGHHLVHRACFDAGLTAVTTMHDGAPQEPHRPEKIHCFFHVYEQMPDFVVDISDFIEGKLAAIAAYSSQFTVPGHETEERPDEPQTFISRPDFLGGMLGRMRHWGFMAGVRYAEGYVTVGGPLKVNDLLDTL